MRRLSFPHMNKTFQRVVVAIITLIFIISAVAVSLTGTYAG